MPPWPPHRYLANVPPPPRVGQPPDPATYTNAVEQAHALQSRGLPAVLTLNHLAVRTGVPLNTLRSYIGPSVEPTHPLAAGAAFVRRSLDPYRVFQIRKHSGGFRTICVAEWALARVQRWIAVNVLNRVRPHPRSFAYAPGSSIVQCARLHCGCRWLVKVDVSRFFESVSEIQVYRVFRGLGYQPLVAFELARLCTRRPRVRPEQHVPPPQWQSRHEGYTVIEAYRHRSVGFLPQGAPTSPMLSNLAMAGFDEEVTRAAAALGAFYTRYSDDLVFSSSHPEFGRQTAVRLINDVFDLMGRHGLRQNANKTVIAPPGARKLVLGLLVDRDRPRLSRDFRSRLERSLHGAEHPRDGALANYVQWRGFRTVQGFLNHLEGLLNFAHMVEPGYAAPLIERFRGLPRP